jgi:hypothetical protein
MSFSDIEYYRQRANTERALAQSCRQSKVALVHEELARQYEELIERGALHMMFSRDSSPNRTQGSL